MFKVKNSGDNPRVFTTRAGQQHVLPARMKKAEDCDFSAADGEYIAGLEEAGEPIEITGSAETGKPVIVREGGKQSRKPSKAKDDDEDKGDKDEKPDYEGMTRAELDDLADERKIDASEAKNKGDVIVLLEKWDTDNAK